MANIKQVMILVINMESRKNKYFRFKQSECIADWQLVHKLVAKVNNYIEGQKSPLRIMLLLSEDEKNRRYGTMYACRIFQADTKNADAYYFTPHSMVETIKQLLKSDLSDFILADDVALYPNETKYNAVFHCYPLEDIEDIHTILRYGGAYFIKNVDTHYMRINARLVWHYPFKIPGVFISKLITDCYTIGDLYRELYTPASVNEFYRAVKNAYRNNKNNIYRFIASSNGITCLTRQEFGRAADKWLKKAPMTRHVHNFVLGDWEE